LKLSRGDKTAGSRQASQLAPVGEREGIAQELVIRLHR